MSLHTYSVSVRVYLRELVFVILPLPDDTPKPNSVRIAHASCTSYLYNRVAHIFQKSRRHLKILGVRSVTLKQVTCCDPQISVSTVQTLVETATWHLRMCTPALQGISHCHNPESPVSLYPFKSFCERLIWCNYSLILSCQTTNKSHAPLDELWGEGNSFSHYTCEPAVRSLPYYLTDHKWKLY